MRPNLTPQELEELQRVTGRDPYPNNFPDDYDKSKIDSRVLKRSSSVENKLFGGETREAMKQGIEISSVVSTEAKKLSDETSERQDDLEERWDAVVSETTDGAEVIEARVDTEGVRQPSLSARLLKDFTNRLNKEQLIKFLAGEDIELTVMSDFNGKIGGSDLENRNNTLYGGTTWTDLKLPDAAWLVPTQSNIDNLSAIDGLTAKLTRVGGVGVIAQWLFSYDVLWIFEQNFPSIFRGMATTAEKIAFVKRAITGKRSSIRGLGSGPSGNLLQAKELLANGNWGSLASTNTTNQIREIYTTFLDVERITSDGKYHMLVNAEASDGKTASSVSIDYANIELGVKFNISEFAVSPSQLEAMRAGLQTKLDKLQTLVDTKQDKLYESGLRYPSLGGGAGSHTTFRVHYEKSGRLVSFGGRLLLPLVSAGAQVRIGSVPSQFAPQIQKFYEVAVAGRQTDLFANIVIDTDGQIYCYYCNTASQYFSLDLISYLTKE